MRIQLTRAEVRSWREEDAVSVARHADNRKIWRNLRDAFPSPYTLDDARAYIARAQTADPETGWAIVVEGEAAGSIGVKPGTDVERVSAEIGYWLAEPFWGRGITTEALAAITRHAASSFGLMRVFALPFEWNPASFRVLEKAGYRLEGELRRSAIKDGRIVGQRLYGWNAPVLPDALL